MENVIHGDLFEEAYGYDEELAKGHWFTLPSGFKVKLAYAQSPEVEAKVQARRNELSDKLGRELKAEEHEEIGMDVLVNEVVLDWKHNVPYSPDICRQMVQKYPRFLNECMEVMNDNKKFKQERVDKQLKK